MASLILALVSAVPRSAPLARSGRELPSVLAVVPPERPNERAVAPERDRHANDVERDPAKEKPGRDRAGRIVLARRTEGCYDRVAVVGQTDNQAGDEEREPREAEARRPARVTLIERSVAASRIPRDEGEDA